MPKVTQVTGCAVPVYGDDIDTDRIIPARYLKEITFTKMGDYPFFDERFKADGTQKPHPFNEARFQGAKVLLGNVNFGCGSSREHAPQALMRWGNPAHPGIKAVVAESFAEIFAGNCVMLGIPAVTAAKADLAALQALAEKDPQAEFAVDLEAMEVRAGGLAVKVGLPDSRRKALMEGTWDSTGVLQSNAAKVSAIAAKLPYLNGFN
ncbi:MAG TPA: 3-isopropylmalate dehydratase small subunit [bacterium]|nr:3-isopropylmalate dehydratase small subunit [bacterium]